MKKLHKTGGEWKKFLTPRQFKILRKKSTEIPFTGKFLRNKEKGTYVCAGCGNSLFSSKVKFNSYSGWPSFYEVLKKGNVKLRKDRSLFTERIEVVCSGCGGHLGHVFDDGPKPTGKRYCINSVALNFRRDN